jgi:hypothetical protein
MALSRRALIPTLRAISFWLAPTISRRNFQLEHILPT